MASLAPALEPSPPAFSAGEASELARELFAVAGAAVEAGGERDQTFVVGAPPRRYVLKISNHQESAAALELEAAVLARIEALGAGPRVPRPLERAGGGSEQPADASLAVVERDGVAHYVRMFEFLEGRPGVAGASLDDEGARGFGAAVAGVALALRGFFHPAAGREILWDASRVGAVRPLAERLPAGPLRSLAIRAIDEFEAEAAPRWPALPAQVVHGDFTLENVLLDDGGRVGAVIDFGDAEHGSRLVDVAAALASLLRGREPEDALHAARLFLDGYCAKLPLEPGERELIGISVRARLAAIVALGSSYMERVPAKAGYFEAPVRDSARLLELLEEAGAERVSRALGVGRTDTPIGELAERRRSLLGPALSDLFYEEPVHVASGEGVWLVDADGRRLLDAYNNVAVVGHCHPRVTEAVVAQSRRLNTHSRYLYEPLLDLAERLTDGIAERHGLDTVMVLNSGSEANDLAWRLARTFTGAGGAIVSSAAYHGMTAAAADLSPQQWPPGYRPGHVETFAVAGAGAPGVPVADGVARAIRRLSRRGVRPAALYLEGGFTSDGVLEPAPEDVNEAVRLARAAGALIVADEVQVGHGRTGSHLWSFERCGYVPDFVTMGKPMGNGYPVAAMVTRAEIAARFAAGTYYFSTFGGNPVAARAALAVLEVIEDERLRERVAEVAATLRTGLTELAEHHPAIAAVRGHGTLIGVELAPTATATAAELAAFAVNGMRRRGVLVGRTGLGYEVLKIRPPLVFSREHAATLLAALDATLAQLS